MIHVITGLLLGPASGGNNQVITLGNSQMHRALGPRFGCVPFQWEIVAINMHCMHLIARMVECPNHDGIIQVSIQGRGIRISMHPAAEYY